MKIKKSKLVENFKKFISRGNVVDMAVGVIIGGAFQSIINALVKGILMPLIAFIVPSGGIDGIVTVLNHDKAVVLDPAAPDAPTNTVQYWGHTYDADKVNVINWGTFINAVIYFFIVAIVLFTILQVINFMKAKKAAFEAKQLELYYQKHPEERPKPEEPAPKQPTEVELLAEIKDQLVELNKQKEGK